MKKFLFLACFLAYFLTSASAFADLDTLWVRKQHTAGISDLWFSSKSDTLKSVAADGQVITWKAATGEVLHKWIVVDSTGDRVLTAKFSPNGKYLATSNVHNQTEGQVKLWNVQEERLIGVYSGGFDDGTGIGLAFTPGNDEIAVTGTYWDPPARLLNTETAQEIKKYTMSSVSGFSPDGQEMIVIGSTPKGSGDKITIMDTVDYTVRQTFTHRWAQGYSPDGRWFAMTNYDANGFWVEIYNAKTWALVNTVHHPDAISAVAFTPGGKFIISISYYLWKYTNVETGEIVYQLNYGVSGGGSGPSPALVSSDSSVIALGWSNYIAMVHGNWTITSVHDQGNSGEQDNLYPFAPNPIHDNTCTIRFHLSSSNTYPVNIIITDTLGRSITVVQNQNYQSGDQTVTFDISNLANGSYTCTMQIDGHSYSQTFTITR